MARTIRTLATRLSTAACTAFMTVFFEAPVAAVAQYLDDLEDDTGKVTGGRRTRPAREISQ